MQPETRQPVRPATKPDRETVGLSAPSSQHLSVAQRRTLGRSLRKTVPREAHAASDIFLGWFRGQEGADFYVRQLEDLKGSVPAESVVPTGLILYARVCGGTLARAHARSGDSVQIAGYLGRGAYLDQALASFAEAYADQSEHDYRELVEAQKSGRIQTILAK